ncbi:MAG: hydrogenase nickel incorporation protein HypB [Syntrophorhabdales bacterium]|jgi:hydrogenase nickel incorporation protein HypB
MCEECGCGLPGPTKIDGKPAEEVASPLVKTDGSDAGERQIGMHVHEGHEHDHEHPHHHHDHASSRVIEVRQSIFAANDRLAERNRGFFSALGLPVLNVLSSPGSGKTTFLQRTIEKLGQPGRIGVIVGDLETDNDARRLRTTGAQVVQITTGTLCHLDADMVARAVGNLSPKLLDLLFIENVGNLVCPSEFDLGENLRVVLLSVTEGEDKPLKYPPLFHAADIVVLTKTDMSEAAEFDRDAALTNIRRINPAARIFEVSARKDKGMDAWCDYLRQVQATATANR